MTIIQPNKHKNRKAANALIICLGVAAFGVAAVTVFSYSRVAGLKHEVSVLGSEIDKAKSANAELKNNLFRMTDPQSLEAIAAEKGLIEDRNPKWVFASL
jgi:cell division protein FtsL